MEIIYIVCAAILLFICGSILFEQRKSQADYIILAWVLVEFFTQISYYLLETKGIKSNVVFFQIISGTNLLHAPLLYLYVVALLDKNFFLTRRSLIHFTPVFFFYLIHLPELSKIIGFPACSTHYSCYLMNKPCSIVFNISKLILTTFYLTLTYFTYREIRFRKNRLSYQQKLDREWAKILLTGGFVINLFVVVVILTRISRIEIFSTRVFLSNFINTTFVIFYGFIYMNFRDIIHFANKFDIFFKKVKIDAAGQLRKVNSSESVANENTDFTLSQEQLDKYQRIIVQYIDEKKPYLDHHLTKEKFSKKTGIPQHHLTVALKIRFQKTFTDFINTYRLEALIEKLEKSQNETFTLLGLAYDCGFNSKSTFNRFFKSQMGVTPSEWVKETHLLNNIENIE